jgi:hypothetical protein
MLTSFLFDLLKTLFLQIIKTHISMKDKTTRKICICSYAALAFCAIWFLLMVMHFVQLIGYNEDIDWSINRLRKTSLVAVYIISTTISVFLCVKFVLNTFKGLRENTAFPNNNVGLLFWLALAFLVYLICRTNEQVLYKEILFQIVPDVFIVPFCILFFAFMYKVAADAVEENNLTI